MSDPTVTDPVSKAWYMSKMLWTNAVAFFAVLLYQVLSFDVTNVFGLNLLENVSDQGQVAVMIVAVINFILRLVTKQPVSTS